MSFLDYFIERTPDEPKTESPKVSVPVTVATNQPPATPLVYTPGVNQQDLEKFASHFDEVFDKANIPGPDYYEFVKMVQAMGVLGDEVKFPAAFNGLKVQGLTKQKLLDTAAQYITVIEQDEKQFASILDTKVLGEINRKKESLKTSEESIKKKEELIAQLTSEIVADKQNLSTLASEIATDERRFNDKNVIYKTASEARKNLIKTDIEKINRLIL